MPRLPIDYSKLIIYKIVCNNLDITDCYVGSTTDFKTRKAGHKSNCNNEKANSYNFKVYQFIRENGGWSNWSMIEIEKYLCNDRNEAFARERYWIETLQATLNKHLPIRNNKEYRDTHKKEIIAQHKEYYEINKKKIIEKQKEYYEIHRDEIKKRKGEKIECECGSICSKGTLARHIKSPKHKNFFNNLQSIIL